MAGMLWSFASVIPLPPSFVAAPVVVTQPAMRPVAYQWPSGAKPATYSPIVSIRETPSRDCDRSLYGSRCFATCTTPPPFTPAKKVTPQDLRTSMSTWLPLVSSQGVARSRGWRWTVTAMFVSPFFTEMKKASLFREAFVVALGAWSVPLPSRTDVRPLNEDDANKGEKEAREFHVRPVFLPNGATVNPRLGALCIAHYVVRHEASRTSA